MRCEEHGLLYDPNVFNGCVVCRRALGEHRAPEASNHTTWLVIGAVVAVSAAASFVMASLGHDLHLGGVPESELGSDYGECRNDCAQSVESCDRECKDDRCRRICLSDAESCNRTCSHAAGRLMDASQFFYATGAMPDWLDVLESMEGLREEMLKYTLTPVPARIGVNADGSVHGVFALPPVDEPEENVACIEELVARRSFPQSSGRYTFVGMLDPRLDGLKILAHAAQVRIHEIDAVAEPVAAEQVKARHYEVQRRLVKKQAARKQAVEEADAARKAQRRAEWEVRRRRQRAGSASSKIRRDQAAYEREQRRAERREKYEQERTESKLKREERRAANRNRSFQNKADQMRRKRLRDEARKREQRDREVRRIDCEARRKQAVKQGRSPYSVRCY